MSETEPKKYLLRDDPTFKDLEPLPLPQKTGDPFFICYTEEYIDLFGYFFALLDKDEISQRGIQVAESIIKKFSSHYTAWWYKFHIYEKGFPYDYHHEIAIIDEILVDNPKSYQAWHYRQWLSDHSPEFHDELPFLLKTFLADAKNFHAWSFSLWYAERWDQKQEIFDLALLQIKNDERNNSAWNARMTIGEKLNVDLLKEFDDVEKSLMKISKNEAAVNFAMALVDKDPEHLMPKMINLATNLYSKNSENMFALKLKLYVANVKNDTVEIQQICDKLMKIDPIRIPYYSLLKSGKVKFQ